MNAPPWIHTMTGRCRPPARVGGVHTFRVRQSSSVCRPNSEVAAGSCTHRGPMRVASRTPCQAGAGAGGCQRSGADRRRGIRDSGEQPVIRGDDAAHHARDRSAPPPDPTDVGGTAALRRSSPPRQRNRSPATCRRRAPADGEAIGAARRSSLLATDATPAFPSVASRHIDSKLDTRQVSQPQPGSEEPE